MVSAKTKSYLFLSCWVLLVILTVGVYLRTTDRVAWKWAQVFVPVWILGTGYMIASFIYAYQAIAGLSQYSVYGTMLNFTGSITLLMFAGLLVRNLDGHTSTRVSYLILPLLVQCVFILCVWIRTRKKQKQPSSGGSVFVVSFLILLIVKLEFFPSWSWWIVFAPVWMALGILAILLVGMGFALILTVMKHDTSDFGESRPFYTLTCFCTCLLLVPLSSFVVILAGYMEGTFHMNLHIVFAPLWVFEGLVTAGLLFISCCVLREDESDKMRKVWNEGEELEEQWHHTDRLVALRSLDGGDEDPRQGRINHTELKEDDGGGVGSGSDDSAEWIGVDLAPLPAVRVKETVASPSLTLVPTVGVAVTTVGGADMSPKSPHIPVLPPPPASPALHASSPALHAAALHDNVL